MRKFIVLIIPILVLSGCGIAQMMTPEGRAQRAAYFQEQEERAVRARIEAERAEIAGRESQCTNYGFRKGASSFAQCMMQLDQVQKQIIAAWAARQNLESKCMLEKGQGYLAPTRSGSFSDGQQNANAFFANCIAGLPRPKTNIVCNKHPNLEQIYCEAY